MKFRDLFYKNFETRDDQPNDILKSHYYRCRYSEAVKALKELIEEEKAELIDENAQYHEFLVRSNSYDLVVTITEVTPVEIAIDFKIETMGAFSFGKGKKIIQKFYSFFDSKLQFKGLGLYKG